MGAKMQNKQNLFRGNSGRLILVIVALVVCIAIIYVLKGQNKTPALPESVQDVPDSFVETSGGTFTDGLSNPTNVQHFAPDEFGAGVTEIAEYSYDINHDGRPDKITRRRTDTETAHYQYEYKIELNNGNKYIDVTPKGFYTIEGSECALQKLQFSFNPDFSVIKISRPMGNDWNTPTQSTKTVYSLWGDTMHVTTSIEYKTVCDVAELY